MRSPIALVLIAPFHAYWKKTSALAEKVEQGGTTDASEVRALIAQNVTETK